MYALRNDKDVPSREVPIPAKIASYLRTVRKEMYGNCNINFAKMKEYCEKNSTPNDNDQPFVTAFTIVSNDTVEYFRFNMSTKRLIELSTRIDFVAADATYKLIFQGFPLFVVGTVDKMKHLHPLSVAITTNEESKDFSDVFDSLIVIVIFSKKIDKRQL